MPRGRRLRLEDGIYRDDIGLSAVAAVGRFRREKRYPDDADLDVLRRWRAYAISQLLEDRAAQTKQRADPRSLARAVILYLKRRQGRPSYAADRSHLKAWLPAFGTRRRHQITPPDVERQVNTWRQEHVSPATIRHRVRVLRELYQTLDGPHASTPTANVTLPKVPRPAPVPVSHAIIKAVADSLEIGLRHDKGYGDDPVLSRARFLVYATTGQRPAQIGRALPGDVDLDRRVWFVRPAKGGTAIPLPLNDQMIEAWRVFGAANAWGKFDPTSLAKVLRRHGWPKGIRPYQLRHTFAIDLLLNGVDLGDVQGLLGHTNMQTTRTFYAPTLIARLSKAVDARVLEVVPHTSVPPADRTPSENTREKARDSGQPQTQQRRPLKAKTR